jgi:hypothetical protein
LIGCVSNSSLLERKQPNASAWRGIFLTTRSVTGNSQYRVVDLLIKAAMEGVIKLLALIKSRLQEVVALLRSSMVL